MKDLEYIVSLGFSGGDVWQAVALAFFLAMIASKDPGAWRLGLLALFIDRFVWPIAAQAAAGAEIHTIYASIGAFFSTFPENLGVYTVRYLGLTIMIALFIEARRRLHQTGSSRKAKPATA